MIRILHAARVESGNGKMLDLELLLNQVGGIFNQDTDKLTQFVLDMKAEKGSMRKAMTKSGISFDRVPNEQ